MKPMGLALAKAGREAGGLFFVFKTNDEYVLLADGRHIRLAAPKRKNPRHIKMLPEEEFRLAAESLGTDITDRQIIRALAAYKAGAKDRREGAEVWQKTT